MADAAQEVSSGNGGRAVPENKTQKVPWMDENNENRALKAAGTYKEASVGQRTYNAKPNFYKYYNCSANNTTYKEDSGGVQVLVGLRVNGPGEEHTLHARSVLCWFMCM